MNLLSDFLFTVILGVEAAMDKRVVLEKAAFLPVCVQGSVLTDTLAVLEFRLV